MIERIEPSQLKINSRFWKLIELKLEIQSPVDPNAIYRYFDISRTGEDLTPITKLFLTVKYAHPVYLTFVDR